MLKDNLYRMHKLKHSFVLTKELEQLYIRNIVPSCQSARYIIRIMSTATIVYSINEMGEMKSFRFEKLGTAVITSLLQGIKGVRKKINIESIGRKVFPILA